MAAAGSKDAANGPSVVRQGQPLDIDEKENELYGRKIDSIMAGEFDEETVDKLEAYHIYAWTELNMQSSHNPGDEDSKRAVNVAVFQKVLELIVFHLKDLSKPLTQRVRELWGMVGLADARACHFFNHGGLHRDSDEVGKASTGEYAMVCTGEGCSVFFVDNVNHLGKLGGFDAVLDRWKTRDPPIPFDELVFVNTMIAIMRNLYTQVQFLTTPLTVSTHTLTPPPTPFRTLASLGSVST